MRFFKLIIIQILLFGNLFAQSIEIVGRVESDGGRLIEGASVRTPDNLVYTSTDIRGRFRIDVPNSYKYLIITAVSHDTTVFNIETYDGSFAQIKVTENSEIEQVVIHGDGINSAGDLGIDAETVKHLPSVSGNIEDLVKLNLGVTGSRNEMSSQYSVRGGNFDENLVYVNGIEVYRPQLIREGQQEGLSFINPDLVSKVRFSAGGFAARYGDKSASVLDVIYKQARDFGVAASGSLLGGNIAVRGTAAKDKFTYITGLRYKNTRYMLSAFETSGDYKPSFLDFQSYLTWRFSPYVSLGVLINAADNKFHFIPEDKDVYFGTITDIYGLSVDFEGQEINRFTNYTTAASLNFRPTDYANYKFTLSAINAIESETYDIYGVYNLNQIDSDIGSENAGDSLLNLGYGLYMEHARNYLYLTAYSASHLAEISYENHKVQWGATAKYEALSDKIDEWEMLDSAGYSIPYEGNSIELNRNVKAKNSLITKRLDGFLQDATVLETEKMLWEIQGGVRANYNTYNQEILISPRGSAAVLFTENPHNHKLRLASGIYYQPPFYKEIRNKLGTLDKNSLAQKSVHFVVGYEFKFKALNRDLTLINELYYKKLDNFIPFELDNVRISYLTNQRAHGYVSGIDAKIFGDFVVNGAESSFTLSVMQTQEQVYSIDNESIANQPYLPRATDQRVSANLFLQDYIPGNKNFKAHLNLVYGTGFPFWLQKVGKSNSLQRSGDYKRVDLGASYIIFGKDARRNYSGTLGKIKNLWLTVEVFNVLDVDNTISYSWMLVVPNSAVYGATVQEYAAPNHLSGIRFNLKLTLEI